MSKTKEFYGERFEEAVNQASEPNEPLDQSFEKKYFFEALNWVEKKLDQLVEAHNKYNKK